MPEFGMIPASQPRMIDRLHDYFSHHQSAVTDWIVVASVVILSAIGQVVEWFFSPYVVEAVKGLTAWIGLLLILWRAFPMCIAAFRWVQQKTRPQNPEK